MKEYDLSLVEKPAKLSYGYNLNDRPDNYVGNHRADSDRIPGPETSLNIESADPVVYLGIETVQGLGDSVVTASMSFNTVVRSLVEFSQRVEGREIYPERNYLPSAGPVKMRYEDSTASSYRIEPKMLA